ncbi:CPBP family intramembrane metalloprotease [Nocardioides guangzhouensis]|uniref:CPBP family intramembrane metalloprotease n=1 Tax=Nocardioides guangzhouensis TaxID=2497878 RepID=A0A4Q4Z2H3_9ACTN|nr:CPBP family intramembrane glutamic endopeptidase [Nocardioides guangzhouensis]RYP81847.1 CPBP family intramembrane metalloprotease [Nocardioides guangzhouensis]
MDVSLAHRAPANTHVDANASAVEIPQYSRRKIMAVWAAAALPMAALAWVVAPVLAHGFDGDGNVPMAKALIVSLTAGLIWQFVLVMALVWHEQRTLRWSVVREALRLRAPRSPTSGRKGGRLWLLVLPLIVALAVEEMIPQVAHPGSHDMATFLESAAGQEFLSGAWGWFAIIVAFGVFNTALGEELLFRGLLLPRMEGAFGRGDWLANGVLFGAYHLHVPWMILPSALIDTIALAYPAKRYRSTWIAIAAHSAQTVVISLAVLGLVVS